MGITIAPQQIQLIIKKSEDFQTIAVQSKNWLSADYMIIWDLKYIEIVPVCVAIVWTKSNGVGQDTFV